MRLNNTYVTPLRSGRRFPGGRVRHATRSCVETGFAITPSDEALIAAIAEGNSAAFAAFYDRYAALLLGVAQKILVDLAEAEDVLQDALVQLWERAGRYDASLGKPLSWAVTLVRNKAIDRHRARQRKRQVIEESESVPDGDTSIEASEPPASHSLDEGLMIRTGLAALPPDQRTALELAFFAGLTHYEISDRLSVPLGTIKARIRRGLLTLRDALEGQL